MPGSNLNGLMQLVREWAHGRHQEEAMVVNSCEEAIGELKRVVLESSDLEGLCIRSEHTRVPGIYRLHLQSVDGGSVPNLDAQLHRRSTEDRPQHTRLNRMAVAKPAQAKSDHEYRRSPGEQSFSFKELLRRLDRNISPPRSVADGIQALHPARHVRESQTPVAASDCPGTLAEAASSASPLTPPPKRARKDDDLMNMSAFASSSAKLHAMEDLSNSEKQLVESTMELSAISESWKLNGGLPAVVSPEEVAVLNSQVTFEGEEACRQFQEELGAAVANMSPITLSTFKDGRSLISRFQDRTE